MKTACMAACIIRIPGGLPKSCLALHKREPVPGNFCKKVFYRNIASAIGIVGVDYFSFSGIFMDMFAIFSRVCFIMLTKIFL